MRGKTPIIHPLRPIVKECLTMPSHRICARLGPRFRHLTRDGRKRCVRRVETLTEIAAFYTDFCQDGVRRDLAQIMRPDAQRRVSGGSIREEAAGAIAAKGPWRHFSIEGI